MICFISIGGITQPLQQSQFNLVLSRNDTYGDRPFWGTITDVKQDTKGYIWLSTAFKGLQRYDGKNLISYQHDSQNSNSLSKNRVPCFAIDSSGIIWVATYGGGLDKFDPEKKTFTHFRHNPTDNSSLANDTVFGILRDHLGNLWIGTYGGLDLLNERTGKFTHYKNILSDSSSLSYNHVWFIYEDKEGEVWVGCGSPFLTIGEKPENGGLNRFNRATGKFTRYLHDPKNPNSISNNKVRAIFEDSKGNFWIGTAGDGLQIMDRRTGKFIHYYYDPAHPEKLSRPPLLPSLGLLATDQISFINEDSRGSIWIGSDNGTNKYDPASKAISHFNQNCFRSFLSRDGLMWFSTDEGDLYYINLSKTTIPYHPLKQPVNSFYYDENNNQLWMGSRGLICKDLNSQSIKTWTHNPYHNGLCNDTLSCMKADGNGSLWITTLNGLCKFDLQKEIFTTYRHDDKDPQSISGNKLSSLFIDHSKNIWTSSGNWIIEKLNPQTGKFTHYQYNADPNNLINNYVSCFVEDRNNNIWVGTRGLYRLDQKSGKFQRYLETSIITTICVDADGIIWIGADGGLYYYDSAKDQFLVFNNPFTGATISGIKNILQDNKKNLWISTSKAILKINDKRDGVKIYDENFGVHANTLPAVTNYKSNNNQLFFGDQDGYYFFDPSSIKDNNAGPIINFTDFKIGKNETDGKASETLKESLSKGKGITLPYNQNTFTIEFFGIDYKSPEIKYLFMLESFDNAWHYAGNETKAYFFKLPPGKYLFRLKAVNGGGNWSEKTIGITIAAPFWQTWWFRILALLVVLMIFYSIYTYRIRQLKKLFLLRAHISRDLHDEIGSTLSGISIIGKMTKQNLQSEKINDAENLVDKIVFNSTEMLSKMGDIVWAINPANDSLEQIISRLKNNAQAVATPMGVNLNFEVEKNLEQYNLDMQRRKNIYLICKEAINNSLKYSQCKNISVLFNNSDHQLQITIQDNGNSFNSKQSFEGNGLKNMQARAKEINAKLIIESEKDKGTCIKLVV